jgi:hypothetical protein
MNDFSTLVWQRLGVYGGVAYAYAVPNARKLRNLSKKNLCSILDEIAAL